MKELPDSIKQRMRHLEHLDKREPGAGTIRLRQIDAASGQFIQDLAQKSPQGNFFEFGTGGGYSALWVTQVCKQRNIKLTTFERDPFKVNIAKETFTLTGILPYINLIENDALNHRDSLQDIVFCFLDSEKSSYWPLYDAIIPQLLPNGILAIDNVISHKRSLREFLAHVQHDKRVHKELVKIGTGILVCTKV